MAVGSLGLTRPLTGPAFRPAECPHTHLKYATMGGEAGLVTDDSTMRQIVLV